MLDFSGILASLWRGRQRGSFSMTSELNKAPFIGITLNSTISAYNMYKLVAPLQKCVNEFDRVVTNSKPWVYTNSEINRAASDKMQSSYLELVNNGTISLMVREACVHGIIFLRKKRKGIFIEGYEVLQNRYVDANFNKNNELTDFLYKSVKQVLSDIRWIAIDNEPYDFDSCFISTKIYALQKQLNTYNFLHETLHEIYGFGGAKKMLSIESGDNESFGNVKTEKDREEQIKELNEDQGFRDRRQKRFLTINSKATTADLSPKVSDLAVEQSNNVIKQEVCNLYNVPEVLLSKGAAAYNKIAEARLDFAESAGMPLANFLFNNYLKVIGDNSIVTMEVSHLSYYQVANSRKGAAIQQLAQGLSNLVNTGIITKEAANKDYLIEK